MSGTHIGYAAAVAAASDGSAERERRVLLLLGEQQVPRFFCRARSVTHQSTIHSLTDIPGAGDLLEATAFDAVAKG
jgi:hypothetical protein